MEQYRESIPLEAQYIRMIVSAIENADYLYKEHFNKNNFPTDNGKEGEIWNYINKGIMECLPIDFFQIVVMNRGRWKFVGIYDKRTKYLYTLMRIKNLSNLRKKVNEHLFHYTNALSKLNDSLDGHYLLENKQLSMFLPPLYDQEGEEILDNILKSMIIKIDGEILRYVLVSFDSSWGQVTDIKGVVPAKGLDYYNESSWNNYIDPTYIESEESVQESEVSEDTILLQRKPRLKRREKDIKTKRGAK